MTPVLAIDADRSGEASIVGAKAARLAHARAAGLPVPDSLVIPCTISEPVLAAAASRVGSRGVHACRLDVMAADRSILEQLPMLAGQLGPAIAVRSSSQLEGTAESAGAFASLMGVTPDEVPTAVLAVWASAITSDLPLAPMGVLIQEDLLPAWAGLAERGPDGVIRVVATRGAAAGLMAGWSAGTTATVDPGGLLSRSGSGDPEPDESVFRAAAVLAEQTHAALGDDVIEWAMTSEQIWLLQSRQAGIPAQPPDRDHGYSLGPDSGPLPVPARVVIRAAACAGDLAERWLLPWALAWDGAPAEPGQAARVSDPAAAWAQIAALARELTAQVWGSQPAAGAALAARLRALRSPEGDPVLSRLDSLGSPDSEKASRCIELWRDLAAHLTATGLISAPDHFGALPTDPHHLLARHAGSGTAGCDTHLLARRAALRWEAALYRAVSTGLTMDGIGVSDGIGCGPAIRADEVVLHCPGRARALPVRPVIFARYPLPRYSPLLIHAAGLVTVGGSAAAHLVSVARALGVPAVIGCDVTASLGAQSYLAVDGRSGTVSALSA